MCTGDCEKMSLVQPAWIDSMQWWADMALKHNVADTKFSADTFGKGESSMTVDGNFAAGQLRQFSQVDFGVFPIPPVTEGGKSYHDDGPWMYGVNSAAKTPVQDESWKFLKWLTNDENGVEFAKSYVSIYRKSALDAAITQVDDVIRTFIEASRDSFHPRTPKYWRIWVTRVRDTMMQVFLGEMSVEEQAALAEKQINEDIASGGGSL